MIFLRFFLTLIVLLILSACFGVKPFQPPPPEYQLWKKNGVGENSVISVMKACGYESADGMNKRNLSLNDQARIFQCMKKKGFTYDDDFDFCTTFKNRDLPACK